MSSARPAFACLAFLHIFAFAACGGATETASAPAPSESASTGDAGVAVGVAVIDAGGCTVTASTTPTSVVSSTGCAVLSRDATSCTEVRKAAGIDGAWLSFSCRVTLTVTNGVVRATTDERPDYRSFYFDDGDACYEAYPEGKRNPNRIAGASRTIDFPLVPSGASQTMRGAAIVGIALNGVPIFGNFAAPGDDIYNEALTFDRCAGHPEMRGMYHYHSEPTSITQDDASFVGMMRDGYAIYGRKDVDGTYPTLDAAGGHSSVTFHSPTAKVYHYHVNEQTSTGVRTAGMKQWFLTTGTFHSAPAACTGC
jgi:hypothetical protein